MTKRKDGQGGKKESTLESVISQAEVAVPGSSDLSGDLCYNNSRM